MSAFISNLQGKLICNIFILFRMNILYIAPPVFLETRPLGVQKGRH